MAKIKVKKSKSKINRTQNQKRTLEALGLKKLDNLLNTMPHLLSLVWINKVKHLVSVEEI